jgi:hypothetical protein
MDSSSTVRLVSAALSLSVVNHARVRAPTAAALGPVEGDAVRTIAAERQWAMSEIPCFQYALMDETLLAQRDLGAASSDLTGCVPAGTRATWTRCALTAPTARDDWSFALPSGASLRRLRVKDAQVVNDTWKHK